jgi:hypothetical protein
MSAITIETAVSREVLEDRYEGARLQRSLSDETPRAHLGRLGRSFFAARRRCHHSRDPVRRRRRPVERVIVVADDDAQCACRSSRRSRTSSTKATFSPALPGSGSPVPRNY